MLLSRTANFDPYLIYSMWHISKHCHKNRIYFSYIRTCNNNIYGVISIELRGNHTCYSRYARANNKNIIFPNY